MSLAECLREQDRVGPNALFDARYYRDTYGDEIPQGMSCLEHFCRQTVDRPRNSNPLFSTRQWHETIGCCLPEGRPWRRELFRTMGEEARFSRVELGRQSRREVVLDDAVTGTGPSQGQEICLFVHFDRRDEVQPYVLDYLDALRAEDVCIVFLTNSPGLAELSRTAVAWRAWRIVCCDNRAYDWGLYATGVHLLRDLGVSGHPLILTNDSVIGTMNSLAPLFTVARGGGYDITGAVDSLLHDWHLQSFFIYCSVSVLASPGWKGFWQAYRPHRDRWFVVNGNEVGFSRWMMRHGVRMGAAWRYDAVIKQADNAGGSAWRADLITNRGITNPTTELWDVMLKAGFPFLKKSIFTIDLLTSNLTEICNVISGQAREINSRADARGR
jgi:hypothetical protein